MVKNNFKMMARSKGFKSQKVERKPKLNTNLPNYSTVSFVQCSGKGFIADCFFHFTITQRTPILQLSLYSEYQYFLYEKISELREQGMTFQQIAEDLNKKKILSVRGKKFKGTHVHSILIK